MWLRYRRKQSCEFGTCWILFVYPLVGEEESVVSSVRYCISRDLFLIPAL